MQRTDPTQLVAEAIAIVAPAAEAKGIQIHSSIVGEAVAFQGDPAMWADLVRQIVNDLGYDLQYLSVGNEPDNTRAWANLALTLERLGRHTEAQAADSQLARIERHAPFHFFHLGIAAMEAGDFKAARDSFAKEVRRAPEYHEFHFWLGLAELRLGNVREARSELALALEHSTTARDHDLYAAKLARLATQPRQ